RNYVRFEDENIDHFRSLTGSMLYSAEYHEKASGWMKEAMEAAEKLLSLTRVSPLPPMNPVSRKSRDDSKGCGCAGQAYGASLKTPDSGLRPQGSVTQGHGDEPSQSCSKTRLHGPEMFP